MDEVKLRKIYRDLQRGATVDITAMAKEDYKEYEDTEEGERLVSRMTLEMRGKTQPIIIANRWHKSKLEESHFYYLDQLPGLKSLLNTWLNKI